MKNLSAKGQGLFVVFVIIWYAFSYVVGGQVGNIIEDKYSV